MYPLACVLKHIDTCCRAVRANKEVAKSTRISVPFTTALTVHVTHVTELSVRALNKKGSGCFEVHIWSGESWQNANNPQRKQRDKSLSESVGTMRGNVRFWQSLNPQCSFINIMGITVKIA